MKVTLCDKCGNKIMGRPYKVQVGQYDPKGRKLETPEELKEMDFCEDCAKAIANYAESVATSQTAAVSGKPKKGKNAKVNLDMKEVEKLYKQGLTFKQIGERFGTSQSTVCNRYREYKNAKPVVVEIDQGRIRALRAAGWNLKDIADDLRTDEETVEKEIQKMEGNK